MMIPTTKTATFTAMRIWVRTGRFPARAAGPRYSFWAPFFTHSGQWNPTEAWCMQAGQMGRSQRWQTTPAGWPVWR